MPGVRRAPAPAAGGRGAGRPARHGAGAGVAGPGEAPARRAAHELVALAGVVWLLVVTALAAWALLPVALGLQATVVTSGSMEPRIGVGDVVLTDPDAAGRIGVGSVIRFRSLVPGAPDVVHRVVEVTDGGAYVTKGDANADRDATPVTPDRVRGVARLVVPDAGRTTMAWHRHSPADLAWAAATLLALAAVTLRPAPVRD